MGFSFQRFQTRLLVFLLLPLLLALAAVYLAVDRANRANALELIQRDLTLGVNNFNSAIVDRNINLAIAGEALTGDFAFRQAWNTDRATLLSAMNNLLGRLVTADFIAMADSDQRLLLADTHRPQLADVSPEWLPLIEQAEALDRQGEYPEAADVIVLDGRPYHLTVLPFLTPDLEGWITLGFEIGENFTRTFKESVSADVSVLYQNGANNWQLSGSTLPAELQADLVAAIAGNGGNTTPLLNLAGVDYVTLASPISSDNSSVKVVLQRSLATQLAPYEELSKRLLAIFGIGLVAVMGSMMLVSRNVTSPLQLLTAGARRIATGDYHQKVAIPHKDEVGELASAFNAMATGLAEKEKMRDLLGKVVSPAIANELMSRRPELGGEEREVTMMFTDIRGFTTLCEGRSPQEILSLLNEYFTALSAVIEQHGGVVDKYIGDAVMA
ncbi:MAG: adenylate/guanylate cyclase domain-containing protein, partial [Pseudomonadota bacterium]